MLIVLNRLYQSRRGNKHVRNSSNTGPSDRSSQYTYCFQILEFIASKSVREGINRHVDPRKNISDQKRKFRARECVYQHQYPSYSAFNMTETGKSQWKITILAIVSVRLRAHTYMKTLYTLQKKFEDKMIRRLRRGAAAVFSTPEKVGEHSRSSGTGTK